MKIEKVVVGTLEENCYILDIDGKVLVVDPGDEFEKINKVINDREVLAILITHNHFDHIGAVESFGKIKTYSFEGVNERKYHIGPFSFNIIFSPGHTSDSVSYYFENENCLFCGDFVFYHSIGRCDLPTGDNFDMRKSIEKIKKLPLDTSFYPGHGRKTTLKEEINNNEYFI